LKKPVLIAYLSTARIPGEKAHSIQIVRTCQGLARHGCPTYVVSPRIDYHVHKSFRKFYGFKPLFSFIRLLIPRVLFKAPLESYGGFLLTCLWTSLISIPALRLLSLRYPSHLKVLYLREPLLSSFLIALRPLHGFKVLFEVHRPISQGSIFNKALVKMLRRADFFTAISQVLRNMICRSWKLPSYRICVLHTCIDINDLQVRITNLRELRTKLRLPLKDIILIHVGHLYKERRVDLLLEAFRELCDEISSVKLLLVGGGEDQKRLKEISERLGLAGKVLFIGMVRPSDVKYYIAASDMAIVPPFFNLFMSSPITLFEYMAACKPIIAPDIPSVREVVRHGVEALLYKDLKDLTYQLKWLVTRREEALNLAINAYRKVRSEFTMDSRALKLIDFILASEDHEALKKPY